MNIFLNFQDGFFTVQMDFQGGIIQTQDNGIIEINGKGSNSRWQQRMHRFKKWAA
jgi:hypothetical protein